MARIIYNKNYTPIYLFIHVAKTGGTFFRESLNYFGVPNKETGDFNIEDHYSYSEVIEKHPEYKTLPAFGFVRRPSDWILSRYLYAKKTNFIEKCKYNEEARNHWMYSVWDDHIDTFLYNVIWKNPNVASNYFSKMLNGCYVARLEELEKRLDHVLSVVFNKKASQIESNYKNNIFNRKNILKPEIKRSTANLLTNINIIEIDFCNKYDYQVLHL